MPFGHRVTYAVSVPSRLGCHGVAAVSWTVRGDAPTLLLRLPRNEESPSNVCLLAAPSGRAKQQACTPS